MNDQPKDHEKKKITAMTFEEAMTELETLLQWVEKGEGSLEQSIAAYERGMALAEHCGACLAKAEQRVEQIVKKSDGSVTQEPMDLFSEDKK